METETLSKFLKVNITGTCLVYRNDKWGYPVYKAKMNNGLNDHWIYADIQLEFPKDTELPNETYIKFTKAFLSFFKRRTGENGFKIIIREFDLINQNVGEINIPATINYDSDDDLPF